MAQSKRRQALSDLRSILNKDADSVNATLMNEFYKHPSQADMSAAIRAAFTNERIAMRNKCITAEYNKLVREEPYDGSRLASNVNSFFRNFDVLEHNIPDIYNVSTGTGITATIKLANKGINYSWSDTSHETVWLKISLKPDSGDMISDNNFKQWFFPYDASKGDNVFEAVLPQNDLNNLSRRSYFMTLEMYEGCVINGEITADSLKFNGSYAMAFSIVDHKM